MSEKEQVRQRAFGAVLQRRCLAGKLPSLLL